MKAEANWPTTTDELRVSLRRVIDQQKHELTKLENALLWLETTAPAAAEEQLKPERKAALQAKKAALQAKKGRAPKKSKKRPQTTTRRAPADDDAPRARKGHVPKVGVEQLYCATLKERQAKTAELKSEGYRRIGPGEPLTGGTYDVRPSGDEDDSCVVLWRAKPAEVDGE